MLHQNRKSKVLQLNLFSSITSLLNTSFCTKLITIVTILRNQTQQTLIDSRC